MLPEGMLIQFRSKRHGRVVVEGQIFKKKFVHWTTFNTDVVRMKKYKSLRGFPVVVVRYLKEKGVHVIELVTADSAFRTLTPKMLAAEENTEGNDRQFFLKEEEWREIPRYTDKPDWRTLPLHVTLEDK